MPSTTHTKARSGEPVKHGNAVFRTPGPSGTERNIRTGATQYARNSDLPPDLLAGRFQAFSDGASSTLGSTSDVAYGSGFAATVTYPATPGASHVVDGLLWSYDTDPLSGSVALLTVKDGSDIILSTQATNKGPGFIPTFAKRGTPGRAMTVELASGGSGVVGRISVLSHYVE